MDEAHPQNLLRPSDPGKAAACLERARACLDRGEHDRAVAELTEAVHLDPAGTEAFQLRGQVYAEREDYDRAIADFTEALQRDFHRALGTVSRVLACTTQKHFAQALAGAGRSLRLNRQLADFARALALEPDNPCAGAHRELAQRLQADYHRAVADLQRFAGDFRAALARLGAAAPPPLLTGSTDLAPTSPERQRRDTSGLPQARSASDGTQAAQARNDKQDKPEAQAKEDTSRTDSTNNLKQIGIGFQNFHSAYGYFPNNGYQPYIVQTGGNFPVTWNTANGQPPPGVPVAESQGVGWPQPWPWGWGSPTQDARRSSGSWAYSLLPFLEQEAAYQTQAYYQAVKILYIPNRRQATPIAVPAADPVYPGWTYTVLVPPPNYVNAWGHSDYAANDQIVFPGDEYPGRVTKITQIRDGSSNTILAGEKAVDVRAIAAGS
jgi:tetratricopeptide (TPR) repeat protein